MRGALAALALTACAHQPSRDPQPFHLRAVDAESRRGVPLVGFETVHGVTFVTDNGGFAVVDEPGWHGRELWFHVRSHGYSVPPDGFGYRGVRAVVEAGGSKVVVLERHNVAERLYRVTGADLYRDSRRLGLDVPLEVDGPPLGRGGVLGQDSVQNAILDGELFWFWGDTNRASYPLGQFATSGAVSTLPADGGLDPALGVALRYIVGDDGFSRPVCPLDGPGPVWIDGVFTLDGESETMWCHFARMRDLGHRLEHGIALWDREAQRFVAKTTLPLDVGCHPLGHAVRIPAGDGGPDWMGFGNPFPAVRVRARAGDVARPEAYEAFTCLIHGERWNDGEGELDRRVDGTLVWAWKAATDPVDPRRWKELVDRGRATAGEGPFRLRDAETDAPVVAHHGHTCWNEHRGRWVSLFTELGGRSMLGEVWLSEADAPEGPWETAVRIATHEDYSFYNVKQHPYFAGDGGRLVYFEGTYTKTFSGTRRGTPRYDYNQILYRLDLDDPRITKAFGAP